MQRPVLASILIVLIVIATLGGLGFVFAASHTTKSSHPEGDWRILDPVVYENIAIFPVVSGSSQDTSGFLTLEEGLASGEVIVSERGAAGIVRDRGGRPVPAPQYDASASVNQLVLLNRSKRPLLLLAGELVSGGKQDRIIGKDRIVPVGAEPLPLDVFCVEHGRWTGSSSQFTASKTIVHPSVREQAVEQKQDEVWAAVAGGTTASVAVSAAPSAQPIDALTEREEQVLAAVAHGRTNSEIGDELYISLSTVKTHVASLMAKLGARNRVEIAMWAYQTRRVSP